MDVSLIGVANAALTAAREIGRAAIGIRDFNQFASVVSQINDQLLKAQDILFAHNMVLQQEVIEAREKLRKMEETLFQRSCYSLFKLSDGVLVYRVNVTPDGSTVASKCSSEPIHYICQSCLDTKNMRVVLIRLESSISIVHVCPLCKVEFLESKKQSVHFRQAQHDPYSTYHASSRKE